MITLYKSVKTSRTDFFKIKFIFSLMIFVQDFLQVSSEGHIHSRFDEIIKSPSDKRSYRGLILENGMKVLLISDPTTDLSAAALDVNVGSMSDPPEIPGLAHFCEHLLFKGTKKYPKEDDLDEYFAETAYNEFAYTRSDNTNYHFKIKTHNLQEALDHFAQLFLDPLFNEFGIRLEIEGVNSEFEKNLNNDIYRLIALDKFSANPKHPYSRFDIGNIQTLKTIPNKKNISIQQEVIEFYNKWYSANIMALSVLGKESLDDLEKMVANIFCNVRNKNIQAPKYTENPFNETHFQHKWYNAPIGNVKRLIIKFPLPSLDDKILSTVLEFVFDGLFQQGEGSLLSVVKYKGWISSLAWEITPPRDACFLWIQFFLTEEGLNHTDEIVTLIFQYFNMLKEEGPIERLYNEYQSIHNISFRFLKKPQSVISIAKNLQKYPIEEVLSAPLLRTEWNSEHFKMVMGYLTPQRIRISISSQVYENITTEVEPIYQTKFKKERIPANIIRKWIDSGLNSDFKFPKSNPFIPTNFDLKLNNSKIDKFPVVISNTSLMTVWFKQDDEFLLPEAFLTFYFTSPVPDVNAKIMNNYVMFVFLLQDSLTDSIYTAGLVDLNCKIEDLEEGIKLHISGYNDKQLTLLTTVLDKMMNFEVDEKIFKYRKEIYIRELKKLKTRELYDQIRSHCFCLLYDQCWVYDDLVSATDQLTAESVQDYIPQFFKNMNIKCLIYGNVRKDEALEIASVVESKLTSKYNYVNNGNISSLSHRPFSQVINLRQGYNYLYEVRNSFTNNSAVYVYYQIGLKSTNSSILLRLFTQIIKEPVFDVLRTKEQLGYDVSALSISISAVQGLEIFIQTNKKPVYVEQRINAFMKSMEDRIKNMSDKVFNNHKETIAGEINSKPTTMNNLVANFWHKISYKTYDFNTKETELVYLQTTTKDNILQFYKDFIKSGSSLRKKLSIYIISTATEGAELSKESNITSENEEEQPILIKSIDSFKANQNLYAIL